MNIEISAYGSPLHNKLGRYADQSVRVQAWNEKLLSNKRKSDGKIILTNNTGGTLHYEDQRRMLEEVVMARTFNPTVFDTLTAIPGVKAAVALHETVVGFQDMNELTAETSMNGSNRKSNQSDYVYKWVPQPLYHGDFHIPWRQGGLSYKQGDGVIQMTNKVALKRDQILVQGNPNIAVDVNGVLASQYGLINAPGTLLQPGSMTDWALLANKGVVYDEFVALYAAMFADIAAQTPNSLLVYTANDVFPQLSLVANAGNSERTNMQRIMDHTAVKDVMPSQWLTAGSVLLVEASPLALRVPASADITIAPWQKRDMMEDNRFTLFAANGLQVLDDRNGRSGVSYATKA